MSVDIHRAIRSIYKNVVSIENTEDNKILAYDANNQLIEIDISLVNNWVDPETYKFNRIKEYPSITDQLDMLWHAINTNSLDKTSSFYTTLKEIKDKYPKES